MIKQQLIYTCDYCGAEKPQIPWHIYLWHDVFRVMLPKSWCAITHEKVGTLLACPKCYPNLVEFPPEG